ncbi:MAG: hypothetical protein PHF00_03215 [Elusimicrobia bacterium]|nr:hypothetical protein [Elusimicrobiota bacterium]
MVDLFGIKKDVDPAPPSEKRPPNRRGQKLWAVLLVLDAVLVIVFGGAVAAKLYQHLNAPVPAPVPQPRRKPAKAPPPAAEAPAPVAAAPAPEPPKPAPEAQRSLLGAPKPSFLAEPPKRRQTPELRTTAKAPAAAAEKARAVPVDFKLDAPSAKNVRLAGAFIVRGGHKDMARRGGTWALTLHLLPATNYRYWFVVDGKKTLDPENSKVERGASVLALP